MAMTDPADAVPGGAPADDLLARAADSLREITDEGWVRARESVLRRVLRTGRPSQRVVGRHDHGTFTVATDVLAHQVRAEVDAAVGEARVTDVRCAVGPDGELESMVVVLSVRFGARIAGVAAAARTTAARTVVLTLGTPFRVEGVTLDLHVADVHPAASPDDPRTP